MIYLYSGTPGSGKSLHTASVIYWRLKANKPVIANFEIDVNKITRKKVEYDYKSNEKLRPDYLISYSSRYFEKHNFKEGCLLLVIDECQLMFNAREWNAKNRADLAVREKALSLPVTMHWVKSTAARCLRFWK